MLIHSNQTRFTCADCGRKFRHPSHFKEHRRRHTGESPYECSDCMLRLVSFNAALQKMCGSETSSFTWFLYMSVLQLWNKHLYDIHMIVSNGFIHSFLHSIGMCRMWWFLPFSGAYSIPLYYILFPATLLHQLFFHLFLAVPLNLVVSRFIYYTVLGILFSSILCTCPNQHNLFNLTVCVTVGFLTIA
jgi:DNA-directed RNA polymerase subunit RPC12/RpoP